MKTGYKVLTHKRRSCIMLITEGGRRYPVDQTVASKRGYGPLCVFTHKKHATHFRKVQFYPRDWLIVKCEYVPSILNTVWKRNRRDFEYILPSLPSGTALATTVTCLE